VAPYLTVEPTNRDVGSEAGKTSFTVSSNVDWTVSEKEDWLSVANTKCPVDGEIVVMYEENPSTDQRIGKLTVSDGDLTVEVTVTQAGTAAYLTVEPSNRDVGPEAGQTTFTVSSNLTWTVIENEDWLSIANTKCPVDGEILVIYEENPSTDQRIGKLTVSGSDLTVEITVTQAGTAAYLTVEPTKRCVAYEAGQTTFEIKSNIDWTVTENADWLGIIPDNGSGDGALTVDYEENSETECRTESIKIAGGGIEITLTVKQNAAPALTITPPICSIGSESCDTSLVINSNVEWTVEVDQSWIIVTPTSGSGDDTLQVHFEENSDMNIRTAILTISGSGLSVEVEFEQDGVTAIAGNINGHPTDFMLEQNYPNPFNPSTTIRFSLPEATIVTLEIYNSSGQKIETLMNTNLNAGYHSVKWNAGHISSGVYFCRLKTRTFNDIIKMILAK
jgi:hypothetical protein